MNCNAQKKFYNYTERVIMNSQKKYIFQALGLSLLVFVVGCSGGRKVQVDPTVVATSYDYTKPADISAQSKPVWVLPIINKGWIPARVDPDTGDWVSGHYQATIIQDGYWATQEEAELSGRPYILAGDSVPVVPPPVPGGPRQGGGGDELNIATMQQKIDKLEKKQDSMNNAEADQDKLAAISTQIQSLAENAPANTDTQSYATRQRTDQYSSDKEVNGYATGDKPTVTVDGAGSPTLTLPSMPVGSTYEIPKSGYLQDKLTVFYLNKLEVQVNYMGHEYLVRLNNPTDRVRVTLPVPTAHN